MLFQRKSWPCFWQLEITPGWPVITCANVLDSLWLVLISYIWRLKLESGTQITQGWIESSFSCSIIYLFKLIFSFSFTHFVSLDHINNTVFATRYITSHARWVCGNGSIQCCGSRTLGSGTYPEWIFSGSQIPNSYFRELSDNFLE